MITPLHGNKFSNTVTSRQVSPKPWRRTVCVLWAQVSRRLMGVMGFALLGIGWLGLGAGTLQSSLDLAGTVVFACMGASCGIHGRKRLGLNGVLLAIICGFLTACGGGTLRTVFMGQTSVFWWSNPQYLGAVGLGTLAVMWMGSPRILLYIQSWEMADHIALGVFVPIGVEHGLRYTRSTTGASILMVLTWGIGIGFLTGVGGGLIRDVILHRMPVAVKTPYGAVATLGAALHMYLDIGIRMNGAWVLSGLIIVLLANAWPSWQVRIRHGRWVLNGHAFSCVSMRQKELITPEGG